MITPLVTLVVAYASSVTRRNKATLSGWSHKVLAFRAADDSKFDNMNDRHMYETIRLAANVYAHALQNYIPISKAAAKLGRHSSFWPVSDPIEPNKVTPIPIQIKRALIRTDTSTCWDRTGGVPLWVALVGSAAANPGPYADKERYGEDEDARKWLAAIAVRCCIVLSFEHGTAILETLKRMVAIETVLACQPSNTTTRLAAESLLTPPKGFVDFAQDFQDL